MSQLNTGECGGASASGRDCHGLGHVAKRISDSISWVKANPQSGELVNIYPASASYNRLPRTFGHTAHWRFVVETIHPHKEASLLSLNWGKVWGAEANIISHDGTFIRDFTKTANVIEEIHPCLVFDETEHPFVLSGNTLCLAARGAHRNYAHTLLDSLARIHLIETIGMHIAQFDNVIVSGSSTCFQQELFNIFGVDSCNVVSLEEYSFLQCERLFVPSFGYHSGAISSWANDYVRVKLKSYASTLPSANVDRLYISRRGGSKRHVLNFDAVEAVIKAFDFFVYEPSEHTVREQIAMFNNAKYVVGAHGGGLTNILACDPGTDVLELFPTSGVRNLFWSLANKNSLTYWYHQEDGPKPPRFFDPNLVDLDFEIDTVCLRKVLEEFTGH